MVQKDLQELLDHYATLVSNGCHPHTRFWQGYASTDPLMVLQEPSLY